MTYLVPALLDTRSRRTALRRASCASYSPRSRAGGAPPASEPTLALQAAPPLLGYRLGPGNLTLTLAGPEPLSPGLSPSL